MISEFRKLPFLNHLYNKTGVPIESISFGLTIRVHLKVNYLHAQTEVEIRVISVLLYRNVRLTLLFKNYQKSLFDV